MRGDRRWTLITTSVIVAWLWAGAAYADNSYRWDIINRVVSSGVATVSAGGNASALANDGSMLTVTGSGTFTVGEDEATGGGTWTTTSSDGTASGNYRVTGLVRFQVAPGVQTTGVIDTIGDGTLTDNRAGLVILRIAYDDGSRGILVVSCDLPGNGPNHVGGAPESIFEGATASKGYVDYWNRVAPTATVNANRTLFHILKRSDD